MNQKKLCDICQAARTTCIDCNNNFFEPLPNGDNLPEALEKCKTCIYYETGSVRRCAQCAADDFSSYSLSSLSKRKITGNEFLAELQILANSPESYLKLSKELEANTEIIPYQAANDPQMNELINSFCLRQIDTEEYIDYTSHDYTERRFCSGVRRLCFERAFDKPAYYEYFHRVERICASYCEGDIKFRVYKTNEAFEKALQKLRLFLFENYNYKADF